jgi:putative membrane protein
LKIKKVRKVKFGTLFTTRKIDETLIREHLALERTKLANERTLLSYTQAALYFLLGGLALVQLKEYEEMHYIGYLALVFSVLFVTVGIWRFIVLKNKMKNLLRGEVITDDDKSEENK